MKELSIEEKAKRYDEAIESAGLLAWFLGERFYEFWNKVLKL